MENSNRYTDSYVQGLRKEYHVPKNLELNYNRITRLHIKSVVKSILLKDDIKILSEPIDSDLEIWKVLIRKDFLPSFEIADCNCKIIEHDLTFEFRGNLECILDVISLISETKEGLTLSTPKKELAIV